MKGAQRTSRAGRTLIASLRAALDRLKCAFDQSEDQVVGPRRASLPHDSNPTRLVCSIRVPQTAMGKILEVLTPEWVEQRLVAATAPQAPNTDHDEKTIQMALRVALKFATADADRAALEAQIRRDAAAGRQARALARSRSCTSARLSAQRLHQSLRVPVCERCASLSHSRALSPCRGASDRRAAEARLFDQACPSRENVAKFSPLTGRAVRGHVVEG